MYKRIILVVSVIFFVGGCATTGTSSEAINPETVFEGNNFKLTSPNEPNWVVLRSDPLNVRLHKKWSKKT